MDMLFFNYAYFFYMYILLYMFVSLFAMRIQICVTWCIIFEIQHAICIIDALRILHRCIDFASIILAPGLSTDRWDGGTFWTFSVWHVHSSGCLVSDGSESGFLAWVACLLGEYLNDIPRKASYWSGFSKLLSLFFHLRFCFIFSGFGWNPGSYGIH